MVSGLEICALGDDPRTLVVRPRGRFDAELGQALLRTVSTMAAARVPRALVDLDGIQSYSDDALVAVTSCRRLAERLPGRILVVAAAGPGARMLRRSRALAP